MADTDVPVIRPPDHRVRTLYARLDEPGGAARLIASPGWLDSARIIKDGDRSTVCEGTLEGWAVIVKIMRLGGAGDAIKRLVGRTRLSRQLHGALLLDRNGIRTARPVLFLRGRRTGEAGFVEVLAMEKVQGATLLRTIAEGGLSVSDEHALARAVGRLTAQLIKRSIDNRDHKPSNIIVSRDEAGAFALSIIDPVGITTRRSRPQRMLANLVWELVGTGLLPRRSLLMRTIKAFADDDASREVRAIWRDVDRQVHDHGDCTPVDDPLLNG